MDVERQTIICPVRFFIFVPLIAHSGCGVISAYGISADVAAHSPYNDPIQAEQLKTSVLPFKEEEKSFWHWYVRSCALLHLLESR